MLIVMTSLGTHERIMIEMRLLCVPVFSIRQRKSKHLKKDTEYNCKKKIIINKIIIQLHSVEYK